MTDFEKKFQNKIAQVKGLKGGHTSGWVKFIVVILDKLYLDEPSTMVNKFGLATATHQHRRTSSMYLHFVTVTFSLDYILFKTSNFPMFLRGNIMM